MKIQILPSLLAADFGHLEDGARKAEECGGDELHLDVMDGHLVPNLSMGPDVVKMARKTVKIPLNVHLMMTNPDQHLNNFIEAGADKILIHIESECNVLETLERIRDLGVKNGITINPETAAEMIFPVLEMVDEVLCMTVHPGYGGQSFIPSVLPKIRVLREKAASIGKGDIDIMVDGGINIKTAGQCAAHGANKFVAGNFLYSSDDMSEQIRVMRETAQSLLLLA